MRATGPVCARGSWLPICRGTPTPRRTVSSALSGGSPGLDSGAARGFGRLRGLPPGAWRRGVARATRVRADGAAGRAETSRWSARVLLGAGVDRQSVPACAGAVFRATFPRSCDPGGSPQREGASRGSVALRLRRAPRGAAPAAAPPGRPVGRPQRSTVTRPGSARNPAPGAGCGFAFILAATCFVSWSTTRAQLTPDRQVGWPSSEPGAGGRGLAAGRDRPRGLSARGRVVICISRCTRDALHGLFESRSRGAIAVVTHRGLARLALRERGVRAAGRRGQLSRAAPRHSSAASCWIWCVLHGLEHLVLDSGARGAAPADTCLLAVFRADRLRRRVRELDPGSCSGHGGDLSAGQFGYSRAPRSLTRSVTATR